MLNLRVAGTIATFLMVLVGLIYKVGDYSAVDFFIFVGLASVAGAIAWLKLFKPGLQRKDN